MNRVRYCIVGICITFIVCSSVMGQEFLLGKETKGATIDVAENTNLYIRFRIQPRLDHGDLTRTRDGQYYESEGDLYLRRTRLEFDGYLIKNLRYISVEGDSRNVGNTF